MSSLAQQTASPATPSASLSPLGSYRRLLLLAGPAYVAVAFLGRLPLAMSQLGTLLLVSDASGSYGLGGLAAGALAVANAVGAPLAGVVADRIGQRPVVLTQSLLGALGLSALVWSVHADLGSQSIVGVAALTGFVLPQVGPLARVRWRPITERAGDSGPDQRRLVDAAFSYEGAADEASFAIGPALIGLAAVAVSPGGALLLAAALLAVFGTAFALDPSAKLAHLAHLGRTVVSDGRLLTVTFGVLALGQFSIGMLFGGAQTGATVLATEAGHPGVAGLVHATLGVGSAMAGIATAYVPARIGHERRALAASAALVVLSIPLLLVGGLPSVTLVVLVLGCAVAPYMIAIFSLAERVVPAHRVGTAMTLLAAATGVGYAVGSTVAGRLGDAGGSTAAFAVTVGASVLALTLMSTQQRRLHRAAGAQHAQA